MEKCGRQKVSKKIFLQSKTQKRGVFQDVSLCEDISTPE